MPEVQTKEIIAGTASFQQETLKVCFEKRLQWFALTVKSRFDKVSASSLQTKGYESFVPLFKKRHSYEGRRREFEVPLFPGYIFCRFNQTERLPILMTPGVTRILGNENGPVAVPESEIASLKMALQSKLNLHPFPFSPKGQKVRVRRGALAGAEGTIVNIKDRFRLVLSISILQRSVLVEMDHDWVVPQAAACPFTGCGTKPQVDYVF